MEDRIESLKRLLTDRVEQGTPAQIVGWASGGLERTFSARVDEIVAAIEAYEKAARRAGETDDMREARKGISRPNQLRIRDAVGQFFENLHSAGASMNEEWSDLPAEPTDAVLPLEQRLIVGRLLIGEDALNEASATLTGAVESVDEMRYAEALLAEQMGRRGSPATLDALFLVACAAFEDLLLSMLRLGILASGQYSGADGDDAEGLDSLVKVADAAIRGGPVKWRQKVITLTGFDPAELTADWNALIETYLRRNKIVHNGGRVDQKYVNGLLAPAAKPTLGEQLVTTPDYLRAALSRLRAIGAGMATLWPSLLSPDERPALNRPVQLVVGLLKENAWGEAERVARTFQRFTDDPAVISPLLINEWMARRELTGDVDSIAQEVSVWSPPDDGPTWRIAVAALLNDAETVRRLIEEERRNGRPVNNLGAWPLIRRLSDSSPCVAQCCLSASTESQTYVTWR